MAKDVIMPVLGMNQEKGVLLQWLKQDGETVTQGEPLMEVETDKAVTEIEAPASGILTNVSAKPGEDVPVGQTIALILAPGESAPTDVPQPVSTADANPAAVSATGVSSHSPASPASADPTMAGEGRPLASPKARRLAAQHHLDLTTLKGSGPGSAVLAADVLTTVELSVPQSTVHELPVSRVWQVMVQRLTQSWTEAPHFYLAREADAGQLKAWREQEQDRLGEKITYTDLLVKLVALSLRKHPRLNASWENGTIRLNDEINISLAVAVEEGLLVPVIRRADQLGVNDLAIRRRDLVTRAQAGNLSLDDMQYGTFTISNLGMYDVDGFSAIVNPPQAAILALGRIADRVVPVDGKPAVRPMLTMTLSCDHRVVDGARAAQFLQSLVSLIEAPDDTSGERPVASGTG